MFYYLRLWMVFATIKSSVESQRHMVLRLEDRMFDTPGSATQLLAAIKCTSQALLFSILGIVLPCTHKPHPQLCVCIVTLALTRIKRFTD